MFSSLAEFAEKTSAPGSTHPSLHLFHHHPGRKQEPEYRSPGPGALQHHLSTVILHDLLHHRQPQPDTLLFSVAHERLKQALTNRIGDPRTVVRHLNLYSSPGGFTAHLNAPRVRRHRL